MAGYEDIAATIYTAASVIFGTVLAIIAFLGGWIWSVYRGGWLVGGLFGWIVGLVITIPAYLAGFLWPLALTLALYGEALSFVGLLAFTGKKRPTSFTTPWDHLPDNGRGDS